MKIKTRESLRDIRMLDKAKNLSVRANNGVGKLSQRAEASQENDTTDYASDFIEEKASCTGKRVGYTTDRIGRWGIRETKKNISKRRMPKAETNSVKRIKSAGEKTAKASEKIWQGLKKAAKATIQAIKATYEGIKALVCAIVAGGWGAVVVILVICLVAAIAGSVYAIFLPSAKDGGMRLQGTVNAIENEYYETRDQMISGYRREREHARQITSKAVLQYSYDGKTLIKRFDSVKEAADAVGARNEYAIRYAALHGTSYQKYRWKYE